ncbi:MAG TPA: hypothetical protein VFS67_03490 [Polyangiaceae bacterium]|nr:hypothetical protein [Polyangiaceae bacterium]
MAGHRGWLAAVVLALACQGSKQEPAPQGKGGEAGEATENKPVVDQKIASAMAAAARSETKTPGAAEGQPPPDGILGEEAAQRELPRGSPAQLVLGASGAEPRVRLGAPRPASGPSGTLQLSYRSGGSVMPTVDLEFKAKSEGAAGAGGAAAASPSLRFSIVNASPAADQPGRLPENARAEIAKLRGSSIDFLSAPAGGVQGERFQVAGNNPALQPLVQGSAVALAPLAIPYPETPVGAGAYWMVKSRETAEGADVIAYRMVKLTALANDIAQLDVSTRRYLITPRIALEGLPPHQVRQFKSEGSAKLSLPVGAPYPTSAEVQEQFATLVTPDESPQQALPVQSALEAKLTITP